MKKEEFEKYLQLIKLGEMNAVEPIFTEYYEKMVFTAYCILHNDRDAQDAASNVIVKLIQYAQRQYQPSIENANIYIYTAIRNAAIDIYHKRSVFQLLDDEENIVDQNIKASVIERLDLYVAINKLSDQDRELVILFYFFDYKIKTIANILQKPIGTIKWKLKIIRKQLYEVLKIK